MRKLSTARLAAVAAVIVLASSTIATTRDTDPGYAPDPCKNGRCVCKGTWEGAECETVKKKCDLSKGWNCTIYPPHECSCSQATRQSRPKSWIRPPSGASRPKKELPPPN